MSQFSQAIAPYREKTTGMIGTGINPPDHSCDNGLLFSACYLMILRDQPDLAAGELATEGEWFAGLVQSCMPAQGLLARYPGSWGHGENEEHDDYRGVFAVSKTYGLGISQDILAYGRKNYFCWNLPSPGEYDLTYAFDRFPGFMATLEVSAGETLELAEQFSFFVACLGIILDTTGDSSPVILQWLCCKAVGKATLLTTIGCFIFGLIASWKYPGGIAQVFSIYWGASHPFALYARKDFL